jgi:hypothetical protein
VPGRGAIRLIVPGELRFRDVAVRAVAAACRLVGDGRAPNGGPALDLSERIELLPARDHLAITISDSGSSFDPSQVATPELELLPEGGMGIHIARACVDVLDYMPGPPRNVWRLTKYTSPSTLATQA